MAQERRVFHGERSGMNLDLDPRLIPNGQTLGRNNVSSTINGDQLVISNVEGNEWVSYTLPSGINYIIGRKDYKIENTLYIMIWNGEGNHLIYRYNYARSNSSIETLVQGVGLNFDFRYLITSIEITANGLLTWTDNLNRIGGLNLNDYASLPNPLTAADRHYIELNKKPNPDPMDLDIGTIYSATVNHIKGKVFKFRSDYVYPLYLRTVGSTISQVAIPKTVPYDLQDDVIRDNVIYITVPSPEYDDVEQVNLYVQSGETDLTMGNWYKFAEIDPADLPCTIMFDGTQPTTVADQTEMLQPYSFIPDRAACLTQLPNNALAFGGPTENIDADITPQVVVSPIYNARPSSGAATTTCVYSNSNTPTTGTFKNINFDIKISSSPSYDTITIGGTAKVGDFIDLSLTISRSGTVPSGLASSTATVSVTYTVSDSDTLATIAENLCKLLNCADTRPSGFGGLVFYYPGSGSVIRIIQGVNDNAAPYTPLTSTTAASITVSNDSAFVLAETKPNLKRWNWHDWAIGYGYGPKKLTPPIPCSSFFSDGYDKTTNDGWVSAKCAIMHEAPADATDWYLYYLKQTPPFIQIWCNAFQVYDITYKDGTGSRPPVGAIIDDTTASQTITVVKYTDGNNGNGTMRVYVSGSIANGDLLTYNGGAWTATINNVPSDWFTAVDLGDRIQYDIDTYGVKAQEYTYIDGDQIRFIAVNDSGFSYFSSIPNLNIVDADEHFVYIDYDLTGLTPSVAYPSVVFIEVWRPSSAVETRIWYQTGIKGTVFESGGHYYHSGTTQNQSASQGSISAVNFGDTYSRYSPNPVGFATIANDIIESLDMSPFVTSQVTSIGQPAVEDTLSLVQIYRPDGIYFSQPFLAQTELNGLSVVLGTSYKDYSMAFGPLYFLRPRDFTLLCGFEDRIGHVGIYRQLIITESGLQTYQTSAVLNEMNYYSYQGGVSYNPESWATNGYVDYFIDQKRNRALRLSGDGITEISEYDMSQWFNSNFDIKTNFNQYLQIVGAWDNTNKSYVFSAVRYYVLVASSGVVELENAFTTTDPLIVAGDTLLVYDGEWSEVVVEGVTRIDDNSATITWEPPPSSASVTQIYFKQIIGSLKFHEPSNHWDSFYDLYPEMLGSIGNDWFSARKGGLYIHNRGTLLSTGADNYNKFYGSIIESYIDIPFNVNSSEFKNFLTIIQEANDVWISDVQGDVYTLDGMESLLDDVHYTELLPGRWSAAFLKDMNTPTEIAPTNPLFEGRDLQGPMIIVRLKTSNTTQNLLFAVTVNSVRVNL